MSVTQFSQTVRSVVRHRRFRHVFDLAIVVNAIFIGADVLEGISEQIFLLLFTAEILLKVSLTSKQFSPDQTYPLSPQYISDILQT